MEILLFALFFISALIFFIAGKDDFGRKGSELKIKEERKVTEEGKEEEQVTEEGKEEEQVTEEGKEEEQVTEEGKEEEKVTEEGNIEPKEDGKKEP
ncbi:hypothetical protein EU94_0724 [Prochlorococcus marinus str. MIT 9123]|uniref:hypothetical protein n=1 Tax=Prochlorococcus marinus TaxID=1219 RepID=UPI0005176255|nr:hypothetical protein [Prochlorococcus marinus]KGF94137.1 hypothetical protein EU94_0724 [Prochlorococcus marinus str. MIT 9123]